MAVAVWPASLPQRLNAEDFSEGQGDGRLRSQMDAGPAKVRSRYRPPRPVSGSMLMTLAQLTTMRSFIDSDLGGGVLPFYMQNHSGSGNWLERIADNMPRWTYMAEDVWKVSFDLEVLPQ